MEFTCYFRVETGCILSSAVFIFIRINKTQILAYGISDRVILLFSSLQRLKFEIAEVMTEIEQLTCVGERWVFFFFLNHQFRVESNYCFHHWLMCWLFCLISLFVRNNFDNITISQIPRWHIKCSHFVQQSGRAPKDIQFKMIQNRFRAKQEILTFKKLLPAHCQLLK